MSTTNAFAAPAAGAPLAAATIQRREVGPRDVLIDISQDLVFTQMPQALPGHEISRLDVIVHIRRKRT